MHSIIIIVVLGLLYYLFVTLPGLSLCCPCRAVTGYMFPGCGIIEDYHKGTANTQTRGGFLDIAWIKEMEKEEDFRILRTLVVKVSGDENKAENDIKAFYKSKGFSEDEIVVKTYNKMISDLYYSEQQDLKLIAVFTMLTLLLTILAMFAMSTYNARQHSKEAALKKVMGSSRLQLFIETSSGFIKSVGISIIIALPITWVAVSKWLEGYSYRIDNPVYVYIIAIMVMLLIALLSISWQMIKLMNTNPVKSLKAE